VDEHFPLSVARALMGTDVPAGSRPVTSGNHEET
jgi:hypothetical protein